MWEELWGQNLGVPGIGVSVQGESFPLPPQQAASKSRRP